MEALKRALMKAKSISISEGASGVYLSTEMFKRLGVSDQVTAKIVKTANEPVAKMVARGDAEIGFEQISELLPAAAWSRLCRAAASGSSESHHFFRRHFRRRQAP